MSNRSSKWLILSVYVLVALMPIFVRPAHAQVGTTITDYYSPCANGTEGKVSTFHGENRDGLPPIDHSRRTYDFRCHLNRLYAPHAGQVFTAIPQYGGLILIDDSQNKSCMILLGIVSFAVKPKQMVTAGTFLGIHDNFHLATIDGKCEGAGLYNIEARTRERPVAWIEIGTVLPHDIRRPNTVSFRSQNPGGIVI